MKVTKYQSLFFELLETASPRERKLLLISAEHGIIKIIAEVVYNMLLGNVPLDDGTTRCLRHYKQTLYILAERTASIHQKRALLQQRAYGAFFPLLLPIISSTLES